MALSQDGYNFEGARHGVVAVAQQDLRIITNKPFGLQGEAQIVDQPGGSFLECEITLSGYASIAAINIAIGNLYGRRGALTGTLVCTIGLAAATFKNATFKEVVMTRPPWRGGLDGSWVCMLKLQWQQTGL